MGADQTVVATFDTFFDLVTLNVRTSGSGNGTVTSDPPGIACEPNCQSSFTRGTTVTLSPFPSEGSRFDEWRGGGCDSGRGACVLVMSENRSENARFVESD
jgi:hypothetical protein